jgi:transposase InsO family protein
LKSSRHTYGGPRIRRDPADRGQRCGKNRIARLMRESGLRPGQKRRFRPRTTESRHDHKLAENCWRKCPRLIGRPALAKATSPIGDERGLVVFGL